MKIKKSVIIAAVSLACASSAMAIQITVQNNLPSFPGCPNGGNSVTLFSPSAQPAINPNGNQVITGDFSTTPLGIQVNNWYWIDDSSPPSANPQNPDNSGAEFYINNACKITSETPPWSGKGVPTYTIANVTTNGEANNCILTITKNAMTEQVTPNCCAPPIPSFSTNVCKSR